MKVLLYLDQYQRRDIIKRFDFLVSQSNVRVLQNFESLDAEFEVLFNTERDRLFNLGFGGEHGEDIEAKAYDNACAELASLYDLKRQILLSVLATMYFQWDKELRAFIQTEVQRFGSNDKFLKDLWLTPIENLLKELKSLGWSIDEQPYYKAIIDCQLVVNIFKHGNGRSFKKLRSDNFQYFRNFDLTQQLEPSIVKNQQIRFQDLGISESQLNLFIAAFRQFWFDFPEEL